MAKLLSILLLVLTVGLFPPAALALISNNAVPGDAAYPAKRKLEDVILLVASVNPATKAWFSAARSNRRFSEARVLIAQGKQGANETLGELVSQTAIAAKEIEQVSDSAQKQQLKEHLVQSIEQYNLGLEQIQQQTQTQVPVATTPLPTTVAAPSPSALQAKPETTLAPAPAVTPTTPLLSSTLPSPTPSPVPFPLTPAVNNEKLSAVQKQLEQIQKDLQKDDLQRNRNKENEEKNRNEGHQDKPKQAETKSNSDKDSKENSKLIK